MTFKAISFIEYDRKLFEGYREPSWNRIDKNDQAKRRWRQRFEYGGRHESCFRWRLRPPQDFMLVLATTRSIMQLLLHKLLRFDN